MTRTIVITSIFPPTEAVSAFAAQPGCATIVVGDKKTPAGWKHPDVEFLGIAEQAELGFRLAARLPYNHYCRKMLGYLQAARAGAASIVDTDDDNLPKPGWSFPSFDGSFDTVDADLGHVNIYQLFTGQKIWPRGLPIDLITRDFGLNSKLLAATSKVGIWQGLADGDPDVDAIYRLTSDTPCVFDRRAPVVVGSGTVTPFNSQNTLFRRELFPLLYLPISVTFRFTDILRGLVAQPIMWAAGYRLGFIDATVVQARNPHDYAKDFALEVPMYLGARKVTDVAMAAVDRHAGVADNLRSVYRGLRAEGITGDEELAALDLWLEDLATFAPTPG